MHDCIIRTKKSISYGANCATWDLNREINICALRRRIMFIHGRAVVKVKHFNKISAEKYSSETLNII